MPELPGGHGSFVPGDPRTREPWHLNQQTILRAGILGAIAIALFVTLIVRLWALQIISGNDYLRIAQNNQVRTVRLQAPRGSIIDSKDNQLVTNRLIREVRVWYAELPSAGDRPDRHTVLKRLAHALNIRPRRLYREVEARKTDPLNPVVVKEDVSRWQSNYILERAEEFPGVEVASRYVRAYPQGWLAAQTLGYVGSATAEQIKSDKTGSIVSGDMIGQSGVEKAFEKYLRGTPGVASQRVDSMGRPQGELVANPEPQPGDTVRLTLDADLQSVAQKAIRDGIQAARNSQCTGCWNANGGAIVALDPRDGSILALASNPSYSPTVYSGHVTNRKLKRWGLYGKAAGEAANYPGLNRATMGLYPPGSTFKPITAIAGMQSGVLNPYQNLHCTGQIESKGQIWKNWDPNANSWINLPTALALSCDTYFYQVAQQIWSLPPDRGEPLQDWAFKFGLGKPTRIEIGDYAGVVPTKKWQRQRYKHAREEDRTWKPGDSINLSIGQKDLQVTPLQMARLYAGIATGKLVTPHLLASVERDERVIRSGVVAAPKAIALDSQKLDIIRNGLYMATHDDAIGTSSLVFSHFPIPIAGKTGTAEKYSEHYKSNFDQSWWCGYGSVDKPEIVVCAVIENGGHGGTAAAPAALEVFQQYFKIKNYTYTSATHSD